MRIVKRYVLYFRVLFSCYIFHVVFHGIFFVLYFCVIYFVLFFSVIFSACGILCYIFMLYFFMLYILCCIFRVGWKSLHSLRQLLLLYIWKIFGQTLKMKVFLWVGQLRLTDYPVVSMSLSWNYLIVSTLNCLLVYLLLLLIFKSP